MSGIAAFSYFSQTLNAAVPSIVDGSAMADKVWFPRVILVLVPGIANLIGLLITFLFLIAILPVLGGHYSPDLLLLVPALMLLVVFTTALALVLSALQVYYRDVRFLVQAALIVWIYATPILYPISLTHQLIPFIMANPMTGIVALVHFATLGTSRGALGIPLGVSIAATIVLLAVGIEAQRVRDRLFVDLL
jgi:ABC-type polysaccharide/polyol phosphate export permease